MHDSRSAAEYDECRLKAQFLESVREPLRLIETLRYSPAEGLVRGSLHVARMQRSAAALGLPFDRERARTALELALNAFRTSMRVRLSLDENGCFDVDGDELTDFADSWRYAISPHRVNSTDPLVHHKTSRRDFLDNERRRLCAESGCDEVLFVNQAGQLTEGSRSTIFIERANRLYTPPLHCGLLDGCLRRELLHRGDCYETPLTTLDLQTADRVFLGNSLRGLIRAVPI